MSEATQNPENKPLSDEELAAAAAAASTDPLADAQAELANLKAQNTDLADQYLRAQADVQNARRRADEEISKARKFAVESFAEAMLPVMDSLEGAIATPSASVDTVLEGVHATRRQLSSALERNRVVGFAITSPASDPDCDPVSDAELAELTVDPGERGKGHGSRLLQAAVDTLVADRFGRAVLWAIASDDALRAFLTEAGWAPDQAHRELDLDGTGTTLVKQVRLHTALS